MSRRGPLWFIPTGVAAPAHLKPHGPITVLRDGPDGGAGTIFGGDLGTDRHWQQAKAGWWFSLPDAPTLSLRTNAAPGHLVDGWLVPLVLSVQGTAAIGYWSEDGFQVPRPWDGLLDRLRALADYVGPITADHATLAADLLAANHHVSMAELAAAAALTPSRVHAILSAACGVTADLIAAAAQPAAGP